MPNRRRHRLGGLDPRGHPVGIDQFQSQPISRRGEDPHGHRNPLHHHLGGVGLFQPFPQARVVRPPHPGPHGNPPQVQIATAKGERQRAVGVPQRLDLEDPASLLVLFGMALVEHHPIPRFQFDQRAGARSAHNHPVVLNSADLPHEHAAMLGEPPLDQFLVVDPLQEARGEAAREALRQVGLLRLGQFQATSCASRFERLAIGRRRHRDILRALQPPFDLQAADPGRQQLGHQVPRRQVLRTQQVRLLPQVAQLAINNQLIRLPARLGTLPAVRAPPPQRLAGQALAAVGDTQGPMDEDLDFGAGLLGNPSDLGNRKFPRQDDPFDPQFPHEFHPAGVGQRHLGGTMNRQRRGQFADQRHQPQVLHNDRIDPRPGDGGQVFGGSVEFTREHQRVERDIAPHTERAQQAHRLGERFEGEIGGPMAGVEVVQPEIDRIGPVVDRRAERFEITRGGQQFGKQSRRHTLRSRHFGGHFDGAGERARANRERQQPAAIATPPPTPKGGTSTTQITQTAPPANHYLRAPLPRSL